MESQLFQVISGASGSLRTLDWEAAGDGMLIPGGVELDVGVWPLSISGDLVGAGRVGTTDQSLLG